MDSIADLITRIKNGSDVGKDTVVISYSKMKESIANILEREGYVKSVAKKGKKIHKSIEIALAYDELVLPVTTIGDRRSNGRCFVVSEVAKERNASYGRDVDHIGYGVCISVARALLSAAY